MPFSLPSPAAAGPAGPGFVCVSGTVNLFQFILPPAPGSVIGELRLPLGGSLPLTQTVPQPFGLGLAAVDRRFATVCGNLVVVGGQPALDVRFVSPAPSLTAPGVSPLLLLLLSLAGQRRVM